MMVCGLPFWAIWEAAAVQLPHFGEKDGLAEWHLGQLVQREVHRELVALLLDDERHVVLDQLDRP